MEVFAFLQFETAWAGLVEAAVLHDKDIDRKDKDDQETDQQEIEDLIDLIV